MKPAGTKLGTIFHVLLWAHAQVDGLAPAVLCVQVLQEGHAPPAPRAGGEALADEACDLWVLTLQIAANLSQGDMKTQADLIVFVHGKEKRKATKTEKHAGPAEKSQP
jgi:hypothetical protein